jgi:polar amino acid transport system substrate-binding protein
MSRQLRASVVAIGIVALLAGCTASVETASVEPTPSATPSTSAVRPEGVQDPAAKSSAGAAATQPCGNPVASLRPSGTLPSPGHMPSGSTMAKIVANHTLRIGVDQNTYLFGYRDPASGQIVGFDIDIARAVARAIFGDPDKVTFVAMTSAQRIPYVVDNKVDLVADTMTINCDRWRQVDFSTVYYNAGQSVLVPKQSTAKGISDLGGKKVCAAAGSTSISAIADAPSHPIPVAVNDWTDCLVMLQQNQVAAISTDDTILRGLAAQDPDTKLVGGVFTSEPYGMAISPKSPDLVRFVNGVLDQMRHDGSWAATYSRWLGAPVPDAPSPAYKD